MDTFHTVTDASGTGTGQDYNDGLGYVTGGQNMQHIASDVVEDVSEYPRDNVSLYGGNHSMQPLRRVEEFMSVGSSSNGDVRSAPYEQFREIQPDITVSVQAIESLAGHVDNASQQNYQEPPGATAENLIPDLGAICEGNDGNETGLAPNQEIGYGPENIDFLLDKDLLEALIQSLTNHDMNAAPLPTLGEGPTMCLYDFLATNNDREPAVFVEATAPQLQPQVQLEPQVEVLPKRGRGRPRKDATNRTTSMQKLRGAISNGHQEKKSKLNCQKRMRSSISEEDSTGLSSDQEYIPDTSVYSDGKSRRRTCNAIQDDCCSSTSETVVTSVLDKKMKSRVASQKSRRNRILAIKALNKECQELERKNFRLTMKAAKLKAALDDCWKLIRTKSKL